MASAGLKRPRPAYSGSCEDDLPSGDRICPFCSKGHREGLEVCYCCGYRANVLFVLRVIVSFKCPCDVSPPYFSLSSSRHLVVDTAFYRGACILWAKYLRMYPPCQSGYEYRATYSSNSSYHTLGNVSVAAAVLLYSCISC